MKKNVFFPLVLIAVFILIVGFACGSSSGSKETESVEPIVIVVTATPESVVAEPTQTLTEQPASATETPNGPTATVKPPDFFVEEFDTNLNFYSYDIDHYSFEYKEYRGDKKLANVRMQSGQLKFDLNDKMLWPFLLYTPYAYKDVRIDVVAENLGTNDNSVNIICRYSKDLGWYEFFINNGGKLQIAYYDNVLLKKYTSLYDGGSEAIRMGKDTNTYTAICKGNQLTLMVNGVLVKTIETKDLKQGQVGIGVYSYDNIPVKVYINSMQISKP